MEPNNFKRSDKEEVFTKKVKAGKRTYFFDVKETRNQDYYIIITESKKGFDDNTFVKHKLFLYKEDFMKFKNGLQETLDHIQTELMPDYDFNQFPENQ